MSYAEIFLLGVALSMDAFAVSICQGLGLSKLKISSMAKAGLFYGAFQALMPTIGYFLGNAFAKYIQAIDHWVAFILLALIGGNMIREAVKDDGDDEAKDMKLKSMLLFAIATSIDALAVGVTFSFLQINLFIAITIIGCTTFVISAIGIKLGNIVGIKYNKPASIIGGIVLICIGAKILIEHLFF